MQAFAQSFISYLPPPIFLPSFPFHFYLVHFNIQHKKDRDLEGNEVLLSKPLFYQLGLLQPNPLITSTEIGPGNGSWQVHGHS